MNYRHIYHAGNFADVFKHIVLILILESLLNKDKPFCYIDTHAGIGKYNLRSTAAQKTKEAETGIAALYSLSEQKPKTIEQYLAIVADLNQSNQLRYYPGSPRIARTFLRPCDRMILSELHPSDAQTLKEEFSKDKQVAVHLLDGYQSLKAFLPPLERRGFVLIDPPYETANEFDVILKSLSMAIKRWHTGVFAVWYPIKNRYPITQFERKLKRLEVKEILMTELNLYPDDAPLALNGSGLAIINPPWRLDNKLMTLLPWLLSKLDKEKQGHYRVEKLIL